MAGSDLSMSDFCEGDMPENPDAALTFAGFPASAELATLEAEVAIVGVPFGSPYPGSITHAARAPITVREQSQRYGRFLSHHDFNLGEPLLANRELRIVDCGDVPRVEPDRQHTVTEEAIRAILSRGAVPFVIGGDHSIPIPVMRAFEEHGSMCVVQVDAHLDFRDEIHGVRDGLSSNMRRASELPFVTDIVQIGIRGVGSARDEDVAAAREYGTIVVHAADIHANGIAHAIDRIPQADRYYITFDIDGIDPSIAPGVVSSSFGGLTYFQAFDLLRGVAQKGQIVGMDVVEVAPDNDLNDITSLLAARLILDTIGSMIR
jgi:agmatinase